MSVGADVLASVYLAPERASAWGWARGEQVLAWVSGDVSGDKSSVVGYLAAALGNFA